MNIHLEVHFGGNGRSLRKGSFLVRVSDFKRNPDKAAALVTYSWIRQLKLEHQDQEVEKVIYNGKHDITDIVNKIRIVPKDNLPF